MCSNGLGRHDIKARTMQYLPSPSNSFPGAEVASNPCYQQSNSQVSQNAASIVNTGWNSKNVSPAKSVIFTSCTWSTVSQRHWTLCWDKVAEDLGHVRKCISYRRIHDTCYEWTSDTWRESDRWRIMYLILNYHCRRDKYDTKIFWLKCKYMIWKYLK